MAALMDATRIPPDFDLGGRVALGTGANPGIGAAAAADLVTANVIRLR